MSRTRWDRPPGRSRPTGSAGGLAAGVWRALDHRHQRENRRVETAGATNLPGRTGILARNVGFPADAGQSSWPAVGRLKPAAGRIAGRIARPTAPRYHAVACPAFHKWKAAAPKRPGWR